MAHRYQREIEEILKQVNDKGEGGKGSSGSGGGKRKPPSRQPRRDNEKLVPRRRSIRAPSPGQLLLAGIALLVAAFVLRAAIPGIFGPLVWVGIGLFIVAYIAFFTRSQRPNELRWRGRSFEDEPRTGLMDRIITWLRGR